MILYEVRNVSHHYNLDHHSVQALCGVHLEVRKGEFVSIAGPSGSGKTTLLNMLGLLESAQEGTICFDGTDVSHLRERERTLLRRERIGFIPLGAFLLLKSFLTLDLAALVTRLGIALVLVTLFVVCCPGRVPFRRINSTTRVGSFENVHQELRRFER